MSLVRSLGGRGPEPPWRVGEFLPFTAPPLATLSSSVRPLVLGAPTRSPVHTSATMLNVGRALAVGSHSGTLLSKNPCAPPVVDGSLAQHVWGVLCCG